MRYFLLAFVFFFSLCAPLIWKMNGNAQMYARTYYARTGEWKLRLTMSTDIT